MWFCYNKNTLRIETLAFLPDIQEKRIEKLIYIPTIQEKSDKKFKRDQSEKNVTERQQRILRALAEAIEVTRGTRGSRSFGAKNNDLLQVFVTTWTSDRIRAEKGAKASSLRDIHTPHAPH